MNNYDIHNAKNMLASNGNNNDDFEGSGFFIPNLCHVRSVFFVVLVSELLALTLSLVRFDPNNFWFQLGQYSIIILWISLLSTGLLCVLRSMLSRLSDFVAGLISYLIMICVTLIVIVIAILIETQLQGQQITSLFEHPELISSLLASSIVAAIVLRFFYLQAQFRRRVAITADAKLQALQARIQPHFLFNSMNIIAGLIHVDPDRAEKVIEDLSDLFRASLSEHRSQVSMQSEIDLCERYLGIEQLRLGERLKYQWQLPDSMKNVTIPPLTLQPLIENAIYHGIQPLVDGGTVSIDISIEKDNCFITIENPLSSEEIKNKEGNSIAVNNIRDRLLMLYGEAASLDMQIKASKCTVILTIPCGETDR
ncbi:MAG: sensor histidine kinase [Gammaproteobacteria bacterium]|nr:sensor histidine kinase [Gammaproteobacteria bacterium]